MRKRKQQIIGMALAALILGSMGLTGCSGDSAETKAESGGEHAETGGRQKVSIMSLTFNGSPVPDDNSLVQSLEDHVNYDIDWTWILDADYTDKISTMIAGGTLPEIVLLKNLDSNTIQNCRAGAFWDLTDYLGQYENLSRINDTILENIKIDGKVYGIPRTRALMRDGIVYREDWLEKVGLQVPTNLDEFEEVLRAFTFDDPDGNGKDDTWGLVSTKASTSFDEIAIWFGAPNGWGEDENGDLQPMFMTDEYFESMNWLKGLYDAGILNSDFVTLENSGAKDAFKAQQSGVYLGGVDEANAYDTYFESQKIDAPMTVSAAIETPGGKVAVSTDGFSGMLAISKEKVKTEEDLKRCLTFLDKLNDEYCANLFNYGIEGTDYEKNADGTVKKKSSSIISLGDNDGFNQIMMNVVEDYVYEQEPVNELAAAVAEVQEENEKYLVSNPGKALLRTSDTYNSTGAQLDQMIADARIQYIVGELDEDGWNQTIESWKQQGGAAVMEEVNASYEGGKTE
ncbi:MAG TPA: extracellular solute-binding protein [Candidatus Fimimorpha excrementavium]|nr:extracellular solute-binding protein [Candidatus Fimimorpha excrementavium]